MREMGGGSNAGVGGNSSDDDGDNDRDDGSTLLVTTRKRSRRATAPPLGIVTRHMTMARKVKRLGKEQERWERAARQLKGDKEHMMTLVARKITCPYHRLVVLDTVYLQYVVERRVYYVRD